MDIKFTTPLATSQDAQAFIKHLETTGKLYHFDDGAEDIIEHPSGEATFTPEEVPHVNARAEECFKLLGDPFEFFPRVDLPEDVPSVPEATSAVELSAIREQISHINTNLTPSQVEQLVNHCLGAVEVMSVSSGGGFYHLMARMADGQIKAMHMFEEIIEMSYAKWDSIDAYYNACDGDENGFGYEPTHPSYEARCSDLFKPEQAPDTCTDLQKAHEYYADQHTKYTINHDHDECINEILRKFGADAAREVNNQIAKDIPELGLNLIK